MEDNYYASSDNQKLYISYFDALYLLNIVFKENKKFEFIDASHVESIWNSTEYKYHKFCVIKAYKYELGGYEVQIGCLLYTSPSPRDPKTSRMPSSA